MKKRIIKKHHVKENVKEVAAFIIAAVMMILLVCVYTYRVDSINNNDNGYTDNGRAHSVNVQIIR